MLMPDIICSKYADMLNDDRTLFQNPSCAIIVWIPGRSGTIFNYLFIKLLPPLSHIDLPTCIPHRIDWSASIRSTDTPIGIVHHWLLVGVVGHGGSTGNTG